MQTTIATIPYGALYATVWSRLRSAASDRAHPMRLLSMATVGGDGRPDARIMTVRGAHPDPARLWFHTDRRSQKVEQLAARPHLCLTTHDPRDDVQLRLQGRASVHFADRLADSHWEQTALAARYLYRTPAPPGEPLPHRDPRVELMQAAFRIGADLNGRDNFAVIEVRVAEIRWLQLREPHYTGAIMRAAADWRVEPIAP